MSVWRPESTVEIGTELLYLGLAVLAAPIPYGDYGGAHWAYVLGELSGDLDGAESALRSVLGEGVPMVVGPDIICVGVQGRSWLCRSVRVSPPRVLSACIDELFSGDDDL